ncbi:MAG: hypothetical protein Q8P59_13905 [Dehalococcoidia bacterium]|nr:hypothetical protein [Dehalococcoidia bacterium]
MEDAWNGQVRVKNEGGRIAVSFCPLSAEVPEPLWSVTVNQLLLAREEDWRCPPE